MKEMDYAIAVSRLSYLSTEINDGLISLIDIYDGKDDALKKELVTAYKDIDEKLKFLLDLSKAKFCEIQYDN